MAKKSDRVGSGRLRTLVVDVGASGIKALILDSTGHPATERLRVKTPEPATPKAVLQEIQRLADKLGSFDRVSVGFPGVVNDGFVETAANLHKGWHGFALAAKLRAILRRPARIINDADLQGLGAISGQGVEMVITLGTAFGSALFVDGKLVPNLELALYPESRQTYQEMLGDAARKHVGNKKWNKRLRRAIEALAEVFHYGHLYIGGGNSNKVKTKLSTNVRIVPNECSLLGGNALWEDPSTIRKRVSKRRSKVSKHIS
jgi:polyphosphate glucokinase